MVFAFQVKNHYGFQNTAASALLAGRASGGKDTKAVRVESSSIRKQFTDNAYIGTNIEGALLHDDIREITGQTHYLVKQEADTDGTVYAHIIFYNSTPTQPYAEFIGEDPNNIVTNLNMNKYTATSGEWADLPFSYSTGTVERKNGSHRVTFTFAQQQATIQLEPTSLFPQNINVTGNFTYRGGEDFATKAIHANWNQDRVVFYHDAKFIEEKWVCFFTPVAGSQLPKATGIGEFKGVTWRKRRIN